MYFVNLIEIKKFKNCVLHFLSTIILQNLSIADLASLEKF